MMKYEDSNIDSVGGYFQLEISSHSKEYHNNLQRFNLARNALKHVLLKKNFAKIYLPYYTCKVVIDCLRDIDIELSFYSINHLLEIKAPLSLKEKDVLLYINYFGIKDHYISKIDKIYSNLIIDNSQSFYSKPLAGRDTFYSSRKFFGVPDGAYLATDLPIDPHLELDVSYNRCSHLLKRWDLGAEMGFSDFKNNEKSLNRLPIKKMSSLTRNILGNIDYDFVFSRRRENFFYLDKYLKNLNKLQLDTRFIQAPMVYPFLTEDKALRNKFLQNSIYVAKYWPDVFERCPDDSIEYYLAENILPLPMDHRYTILELDKVLSLIL